jgi:hypothetical protein
MPLKTLDFKTPVEVFTVALAGSIQHYMEEKV